jgi:hypothetical protein
MLLCSGYTKASQAAQFVTLLGTNTNSLGEPYIETSTSGTNYYAKGHLSPDAAFIYNAFQGRHLTNSTQSYNYVYHLSHQNFSLTVRQDQVSTAHNCS